MGVADLNQSQAEVERGVASSAGPSRLHLPGREMETAMVSISLTAPVLQPIKLVMRDLRWLSDCHSLTI